MEEAQAVCDRVAIIDHGRIVANESPASLVATYRDDPRVVAVTRGETTLEGAWQPDVAGSGRETGGEDDHVCFICLGHGVVPATGDEP